VRADVLDVGSRWARCQRDLLGLVVTLDRSGAWAFDGARTCSHWVADALDIEICTAREWIRVGVLLEQLPSISTAFEASRLSYSKLRTLTRVATPENEAELCELAERTPAGQLACAVAAFLSRHEEPEETERRQHEARSFTWRIAPDGMVVGTFRLAPLAAAQLTRTVDASVMRGDHRLDAAATEGGENASTDASSPRSAAKWPSMAQQRADALVALVQAGATSDKTGTTDRGNASGSAPRSSPISTEIVLHVRGDGCTLDDGTPIAGSIVERIAPESFLRVLIHDAESRPINASGKHRHPTARQQRVVHERDRRCVDCGTTDRLECDHVPPFEATRRTVIDELELRCGPCHRMRHANEQNTPNRHNHADEQNPQNGHDHADDQNAQNAPSRAVDQTSLNGPDSGGFGRVE